MKSPSVAPPPFPARPGGVWHIVGLGAQTAAGLRGLARYVDGIGHA